MFRISSFVLRNSAATKGSLSPLLRSRCSPFPSSRVSRPPFPQWKPTGNASGGGSSVGVASGGQRVPRHPFPQFSLRKPTGGASGGGASGRGVSGRGASGGSGSAGGGAAGGAGGGGTAVGCGNCNCVAVCQYNPIYAKLTIMGNVIGHIVTQPKTRERFAGVMAVLSAWLSTSFLEKDGLVEFAELVIRICDPDLL